MKNAPPADHDDMVQAGHIGLMLARRDCRDDTTFGAYAAQRIRGEVLDYLRARSEYSRADLERIGRFRRARDSLPGALLGEIAEAAGMTLAEAAAAEQNMATQYQSGPVPDTAPGPLETLEQSERMEWLDAQIRALPETDRDMLQRRLNGERLRDIAGDYGTTDTWICAVCQRAARMINAAWMNDAGARTPPSGN